jgi:hypothetical protein
MEMQTARLADDSNAAALAALSADGPGRLASVAPTRPGMSPCPHCHEAFGSASLAIHIKRCRALLPDPEAEAAAAEAAAMAAKAIKNLKKRQVPTLVDLCVSTTKAGVRWQCGGLRAPFLFVPLAVCGSLRATFRPCVWTR